jgi:hypothetical protein
LLIYLLEMHHACYALLVLPENQNPFLKLVLISGVAVVTLSSFLVLHWWVAGLVLTKGGVQAIAVSAWESKSIGAVSLAAWPAGVGFGGDHQNMKGPQRLCS